MNTEKTLVYAIIDKDGKVLPEHSFDSAVRAQNLANKYQPGREWKVYKTVEANWELVNQ